MRKELESKKHQKNEEEKKDEEERIKKKSALSNERSLAALITPSLASVRLETLRRLPLP